MEIFEYITIGDMRIYPIYLSIHLSIHSCLSIDIAYWLFKNRL